ncbi:MAG: hypothetical protein I3270_02670 [Candidatus Moeniiplasma glomeromycotorum]|nr:hypothetical protein [Candidatus Moeniiplasma glomeromycotorum]MCE8162548.1 hypothetical protein [Candidatus Moeniiplasma glomeromycotorum]MCE8166525.1 hypothetical protein [Candidatus Moeniiplasma glomeromycotorum]MCE8167003.1 hypothetical protein [Candidatus Moeniiplasma glomeromycotorum]
MVNVYAERSDIKSAENSTLWSRACKVGKWAFLAVAAPFLVIGFICTFLGEGCQAQAESFNTKSEQHEQQAEQTLNDSKENWKRKVRSEKVDSDSISVTSSEDGEVVDLLAA